MLQSERRKALKALAKLNPKGKVGGIWKNPLNPKSRGIRWTPQDLDLRKYQRAAR
jgi:hypothetical protein